MLKHPMLLPLSQVTSSKYLDSTFTSDNKLDAENPLIRVDKALEDQMWPFTALSVPTKLQLLQTIILSMLLHDGATETKIAIKVFDPSVKARHRLPCRDAFYASLQRSMSPILHTVTMSSALR